MPGDPNTKRRVGALKPVIIKGKLHWRADRSDYDADYYDTNYERIRARQNAYMRRRRKERSCVESV